MTDVGVAAKGHPTSLTGPPNPSARYTRAGCRPSTESTRKANVLVVGEKRKERTRSPEDNRATFLLTNILPQTHDLNGGPWLRLEEHCRELATMTRTYLGA